MNKPPRTYSIIVPTKTYLRKYVYAEHGFPLNINYTTTLGTLILCMLEKEVFTVKMSEPKKEMRIQFMNDHLEFSASLNTMHYKGSGLSKEKVIAINRYIENSFVEDLHRYCKYHIRETNWRPGIKDAIYAFAESYGIDVETDISFEALKKAEFRYKKRMEEKKLQKTLVTSVPNNINPLQSLFFPAFAY
jgi:midasin (ATPase involved in ribosome maturation)